MTHNLNLLINKKLVYRARLLGHIWMEESRKGTKKLVERMDNDIASSNLYVAVFTVNGRLLYHRNVPHLPLVISKRERRYILANRPVFHTELRGGKYFRTLITPFYEKKKMVGFIFLEDPLKALQKIKHTFLFSIPIAAIVFFIPVFLLAKLLIKKVFRSIENIEYVADRISAEDFNERIKINSIDLEFRQIATHFNRMCDRLEDSFNNLRRFTSDASHQLRTPLAILKSNLEVALMRERSTVEYVETISNCLEEIDRLSKIVNCLLLITRVEAGENVFTMISLNLSSLVRDVVEFITPLAEDKNIQISLSIDENIPFRGDEEWLRHLVFNLLDNSIKYCRPSDKITVSIEKADSNLLFKVCDTGVGISSEHLSHIFERFYRISDAQAHRGVGIGLAICQWVIRGHKGNIEVHSEEGKGTSITVTFPMF